MGDGSQDIRRRVEEVLEQAVRPILREHGGDVQVTDIEADTVYIRLRGQCASCASAQHTVEELIERALAGWLKEIHQVAIDPVDPELRETVRKILRRELRF